MYAVLGLCQILGAMQYDTAADSRAPRCDLFKKEAVRRAVIINTDFLRIPPLKMVFQGFPQLVPQARHLNNLMQIFPAVELIASCDLLRDGELAPLCVIRIFSGLRKGVKRPIGQPNAFLPAPHAASAFFLQPGELDLQHLHTIRPFCQPQGSKRATVAANQVALRPLLQLLKFPAQESKPGGGFSSPG